MRNSEHANSKQANSHFFSVHEHQSLRCGQGGFTERHWELLLQAQDYQVVNAYQILHRGVKFGHYVGVLQIEDLCIEILPKNDAKPDKQGDRDLLLRMLAVASDVPIYVSGDADLDLGNGLLDVYLHAFLQSVEQLLRFGLQRHYQQKSGVLPYWKGKLNIQKQVYQSFIHKERLALTYQSYDYQHPAHSLIYAALEYLAPSLVGNRYWDKLQRLLADFPPQLPFSGEWLDGRNMPKYYQKPLHWAQWILANKQPNLRAGGHSALSLLVDMNRLFEDYVYRLLQTVAKQLPAARLYSQPVYAFWEEKRLRPDLVLEWEGKKIVLDSKWKRLQQPSPSDEDLRQLFAYQQLIGANDGILVYPALPHLPKQRSGHFYQNEQQSHLYFLDLETKNAAQELAAFLKFLIVGD